MDTDDLATSERVLDRGNGPISAVLRKASAQMRTAPCQNSKSHRNSALLSVHRANASIGACTLDRRH